MVSYIFYFATEPYVGSDAGETVMNIAKLIGKVIGLG
ncbi:hypothetical protein ACUXTG_002429 [Staphylococcus capitis]